MKYWTKEWYRDPEGKEICPPDEEEYEKVLSLLPPFYAQDFALYGCVLKEAKEEGNTLFLSFDASDSYTSIDSLTFTGAEWIEKETEPKAGLVWLYDEIYRENGRFVLHILMRDEEDGLYYMTLAFDTIDAGYDEEKKRQEDTLFGLFGTQERDE